MLFFPAFLKKELVMRYLRASDLFILPTGEDIWGLVVNEAMACGLPVITTNMCVAGIELIADGVNGFMIPVGDINALHQAIVRILDDDDLRLMMSKNSLETIRPYTYEDVCKSHLEAINSYFKKGNKAIGVKEYARTT